MSNLWTDLIKAYAAAEIEAPGLKIVTLAQWALESGFGNSPLALQHLNFAGLKYRARINQGHEDPPLAVPVDYQAHDGEDTYCKFASLEDFIAGYWAFIANGSMYDGWREFADDPSGYIAHIHRAGYAGDPDYVTKVLGIVPRIQEQIAGIGLERPLPEARTGAERHRVAVLIGHNEKSQGAYSDPMQVSEWRYNQRVARQMEQHCAEYGLEIRTFFRQQSAGGYTAEITAAYATIDAWGPDLIVELHFNSGGGHGSETLYWHASGRSSEFAGAMQRGMTDVLGLTSRGVKAVTDGQNGAGALKASSHPTVIVEPFFGDSAGDCGVMMRLGEYALARAYLIGLRDAATASAVG